MPHHAQPCSLCCPGAKGQQELLLVLLLLLCDAVRASFTHTILAKQDDNQVVLGCVTLMNFRPPLPAQPAPSPAAELLQCRPQHTHTTKAGQGS